MGRPKSKEPTKDKRFWVRCSTEHYNQILSWAQDKGVSMGETVISKLFNIDIVPAPEVKECEYYVKNTKGEPVPYKLQYKTKKRGLLKPAEPEKDLFNKKEYVEPIKPKELTKGKMKISKDIIEEIKALNEKRKFNPELVGVILSEKQIPELNV